MSRALVFEGVRKRFGRHRPEVLAGIDLVVPAGRTTVLLGTSGSGKSTLLRIAAGLLEADAGRVLLGAETLSDPRLCVAPERRRLGFVFQDLELWPHRSVAENVAFGLPGRPRGRRAAAHPRVRLLAERLGFAEHLLRRPPALSGGERQRVALARALAPAPDVVLLDEPLASLDPGRQSDLRALLQSVFREQGATVLHVTHDPLEALTLGDRLAVLDGGVLVEHGTPEQVYRAPATVAGARALGAANVLPAVREGDCWRTPLGVHAARTGDAADATHVLVRPEGLVAGAEGAVARVIACRPDGAGWRLSVQAGAQVLEACAAAAAEPGHEVRLVVTGPVGGVRATAPKEQAA